MCNVGRIECAGTGVARRPFFVVVHDVCPVYSHEIQKVVAALLPLLGRTISAAVVPHWHGVAFDAETCFAEWVKQQFAERLLHGWTHRREAGRGMISYFTNGSDEFSGLTRHETSARIQLGQGQLANIFGDRATGFVAPAWQRGRVDRQTLKLHGLEFLLGYFAIEFLGGKRIPVSTVTWDVGRFGRLGCAAEIFGHGLGLGRGRSIRCLAAHPADVSRGYLPRIIRTVESWMRLGGTPILPSQLRFMADGDSRS